MAISSPGVGSGLDVNGIVSKLMEVERYPLTALVKKQTGITAKISALGTLTSAVDQLKTTASAMSTGTTFAAFKASVADSSIATATAATGALAGTYALQVSFLAQAQIAHTASNPAVADGKLTIQLGAAAAVDITVNASDSLTDIASRINADATLGSQIRASVVDSKLVFESKLTGAANTISVAGIATDGGTGLDAFDTANLTTARPAQNALFKLNGIEISRSTNTVTDVVDNVTLQLKSVSANTTQVEVARNKSDVQGALADMVLAYNSTIKILATQGQYDAATRKGAVLAGDPALRGTQTQLRGALTNVPASLSGATFTTLAELGVTRKSDGTLVYDATKLQAAFDSDPAAVETAVKAYGTELLAATKAIGGAEGVVSTRVNSFKRSVSDIDKRMISLELRMTNIEARYRAQFSALDTLMSSYNSTSSFLTQQLAQKTS
jgi:flagellar hook-associated protein 2